MNREYNFLSLSDSPMKTARFFRISLSVFLLSLYAIGQNSAIPAPPDTPKRPVTDQYFGVRVTDNYRWLENWDDPAVKQWSAAENARTREYFDRLPARDAIKNRLKQLIAGSSAEYYDLQFRAGRLFAEKYQAPKEQPTLVVMQSADDPASAKVVFDPNAASAKGSLSVDFYVPSFGGKYVAAALSENGSEDSSAHVFDVETGKELPDVVPRVNFATGGGSIAWKADSSGFYYTRYPQGNERPPEDANFYQQVYFHKLGTDPKEDTYVIGKDFPRIAEILLQASDDGNWLLASVANGDGGQFAHYLMDSSGKWTQIDHFEDGIVRVKFGVDPALYLLSRKDAPRGQILRLPLAHLDLAQAKVVVPQTPGAASGSSGNEADRASIEDFRSRLEPALRDRHYGWPLAHAHLWQERYGTRPARRSAGSRAHGRSAAAAHLGYHPGAFRRRRRRAFPHFHLHRTARLVRLRRHHRQGHAHRAV